MWKHRLKSAGLSILLATGVNLQSLGFGAAALEYISSKEFEILSFGLWSWTVGIAMTLLYALLHTLHGE